MLCLYASPVFVNCTVCEMAAAVERTDDLVREYLIYRGFNSTLKHLDSEIKSDKEKGFRVSLCVYSPPPACLAYAVSCTSVGQYHNISNRLLVNIK